MHSFPLLLVPQILPSNICSVYMPKKLYLSFSDGFESLSMGLSYLAISITSLFDFFSVHDILSFLLMYHICAASSLLSRSFVSVQHSHTCKRMDHIM